MSQTVVMIEMQTQYARSFTCIKFDKDLKQTNNTQEVIKWIKDQSKEEEEENNIPNGAANDKHILSAIRGKQDIRCFPHLGRFQLFRENQKLFYTYNEFGFFHIEVSIGF